MTPEACCAIVSHIGMITNLGRLQQTGGRAVWERNQSEPHYFFFRPPSVCLYYFSGPTVLIRSARLPAEIRLMGFLCLGDGGRQAGRRRPQISPCGTACLFSVKAGYKNGLYIKEEEPDLDSLQPPEGGDCPVFFTIPFSDSFAGLKGSFCLHLCTALLQMGSALYLVCILHKRDGKKRVTA